MKWTPAVAIAISLLTKGPVLAAVILAVAATIIVIATYILIAHREVAPRVRWGGLKIDFRRLDDDDDPD